MSINNRKEHEAKFKIGDTPDAFEIVKPKMLEAGFKFRTRQIETDYLPDTEDSVLKRAGLLLRFRRVESEDDEQWILTLKTKVSDGGILSFDEFETPLVGTPDDTFNFVASSVADYGINLPDTVCGVTDLSVLQSILGGAGLTKRRILLDKYRQGYSDGSTNVLLDYFPGNMGTFVEVEAFSVDALKSVYGKLGFQTKDIVGLDYGDILKEHRAHIADENSQRTSLFSADEKRILLS